MRSRHLWKRGGVCSYPATTRRMSGKIKARPELEGGLELIERDHLRLRVVNGGDDSPAVFSQLQLVHSIWAR